MPADPPAPTILYLGAYVTINDDVCDFRSSIISAKLIQGDITDDTQDDLELTVHQDKEIKMNGVVNMTSHTIKNVADATELGSAVNLKQLQHVDFSYKWLYRYFFRCTAYELFRIPDDGDYVYWSESGPDGDPKNEVYLLQDATYNESNQLSLTNMHIVSNAFPDGIAKITQSFYTVSNYNGRHHCISIKVDQAIDTSKDLGVYTVLIPNI